MKINLFMPIFLNIFPCLEILSIFWVESQSCLIWKFPFTSTPPFPPSKLSPVGSGVSSVIYQSPKTGRQVHSFLLPLAHILTPPNPIPPPSTPSFQGLVLVFKAALLWALETAQEKKETDILQCAQRADADADGVVSVVGKAVKWNYLCGFGVSSHLAGRERAHLCQVRRLPSPRAFKSAPVFVFFCICTVSACHLKYTKRHSNLIRSPE